MAAETDLINLYSGRILALAADIPRTDRLPEPDGTARQRSPLCGSTVTVDVNLDEHGRVADYGQDVKACALGQAAASVIGSAVIGRNIDEIERARTELRDMLKNNGHAPSEPFQALGVLQAAKDYSNRHASILLTFDALLEAMGNAQEKTAAPEISGRR